jgi:hypothetical protein
MIETNKLREAIASSALLSQHVTEDALVTVARAVELEDLDAPAEALLMLVALYELGESTQQYTYDQQADGSFAEEHQKRADAYQESFRALKEIWG